MSQIKLNVLKCSASFATSKSSCPEVLYKKETLKIFVKFTGKHLCQCVFFNKVVGLRSVTLLRMRPRYKCFSVNFPKFLRIPYLWNTFGSCLCTSKKVSTLLCFYFVRFLINGFFISLRKASYDWVLVGISQENLFSKLS